MTGRRRGAAVESAAPPIARGVVAWRSHAPDDRWCRLLGGRSPRSAIGGAADLASTGGDPLLAYGGLWEGSLGQADSISETLVWATPYILAGLAVALAFKAGLFNIGAEGQFALGALARACVGYAVHGVPWPLHLLLAIGGRLRWPARSGRARRAASRRRPAPTKSSPRSC